MARGGFSVNYNEQCKSKQCEHYIEWQFFVDGYEQPYDCTSCKLQGQSYDIDAIAEDCPHKDRAIIQQVIQPDNAQ